MTTTKTEDLLKRLDESLQRNKNLAAFEQELLDDGTLPTGMESLLMNITGIEGRVFRRLYDALEDAAIAEDLAVRS